MSTVANGEARTQAIKPKSNAIIAHLVANSVNRQRQTRNLELIIHTGDFSSVLSWAADFSCRARRTVAPGAVGNSKCKRDFLKKQGPWEIPVGRYSSGTQWSVVCQLSFWTMLVDPENIRIHLKAGQGWLTLQHRRMWYPRHPVRQFRLGANIRGRKTIAGRIKQDWSRPS
jgi:hypothetical protein